MDQLRPKTGNPLAITSWFLSILLVLCLTNVPKKYYHGTGSYQLSAQHKVGLLIVAWDNVL